MEQVMSHLADLFDKGGVVMWVILVVSVYGASLVVERWLQYGAIAKAVDEHQAMINKATTLTTEMVEQIGLATPTGRIVQVAWSNRGRDKESMIERTRTTFMAEGGLIEKRLGGVAVIGSLLPMLGLLGTVVGMITAFNAIAMHGTGDPKILADGISQALLTTEAGLVTSIPLLYIHHILADRADLLVQKLDTFATHALHLVPESGVSAAGN